MFKISGAVEHAMLLLLFGYQMSDYKSHAQDVRPAVLITHPMDGSLMRNIIPMVVDLDLGFLPALGRSRSLVFHTRGHTRVS
jgi:hypothetical protein